MPKKHELYHVHTSLDDDNDNGWIWFRDPGLQGLAGKRLIVRVTANTGRSVFCDALYADSRYLEKWYAIWKTTNYPIPPADANLAFISPWYRSKLGIEAVPQHLQVEYRESLSPVAWQVHASLDHPQVALRSAAALALIGLAVGAGLALGVVLNQFGILPIAK
jgi:hypothetical protein